MADVDLPGAATVVYVTSPVAHARLLAVDVDDARSAPGVIAVVTKAEIDVGPHPPVAPGLPAQMRRPLLADGVVRYVGEPIVAIVSETPEAGADAAERVVIDFDPLPAVTTVEDGLAGDVLLFPDAGTNIVLEAAGGDGEVDFDGCDVVIRATFKSPRLAPCPMETRSAASRWEDDGRVTHWSSCQGAHPVRGVLCAALGLAPEQVRVIVPEVGGSFGAKGRPYPEEVLLPWLAKLVGRPVRWTPTRSQDMVGLGHSREQVQQVELGGRRDGTLLALRLFVIANAGAYPSGGVLLPRNTGALSSGAYRIPNISWRIQAVLTTTTPSTAYRGAGRPEAAAFLERAVDIFAAEIGMDPADVRRRNFLQPDDFPYLSATGILYDSGNYRPALDAALATVDYGELRALQAQRRASGAVRQLGIGIATFVDRTAGVAGTEFGAVELRSDGTVLARTGSTPYGQGHETSWRMLVADRTGLPLDHIEVIHGDTDLIPRSGVTGGSRSVQKAGSAMAEATDGLVERAREIAARHFEAAVEDVVLDLADGGRFHVVGTPTLAMDWAQVAAATDEKDVLKCEADVGGEATFPSGAYVAVVEADTETGAVDLLRLVTVDDAGCILNPLLALGQVHGGAAQGVAQALLEQFVYDDDGNPLTSNFADYTVISACELPSFESSLVETPSPNNVLGAKGIGESGTIGAPPAVQNAVVDALSWLGVRHIDMPCTPERVWTALREAAAAGEPEVRLEPNPA